MLSNSDIPNISYMTQRKLKTVECPYFCHVGDIVNDYETNGERMALIKGSEHSLVYWVAIFVAIRCMPLVRRA